MQISLHQRKAPKLHLGVIMDGNGRWATLRGRPRAAGHRAGADAVRRLIEAASEREIEVLTLFAFSTENWRRPDTEVAALMELLRLYLRAETARLIAHRIKLQAIGRRDRLPADLVQQIAQAEAQTAAGDRFVLRIAIDYSARDALLQAAARARRPEDFTRDGFSRLLAKDQRAQTVDLIIRTSGEQRLSDFLLWEAAFAELYFTDRPWPDFTAADLDAALDDFHARDRRYGALSNAEA